MHSAQSIQCKQYVCNFKAGHSITHNQRVRALLCRTLCSSPSILQFPVVLSGLGSPELFLFHVSVHWSVCLGHV